MNEPNGYYNEEVHFSHKDEDYYTEIEVYDHDQWKVMKVCKYDEPEIWEDMTIVSAELTKVMVIAIEKYVAELDKPYVPSDYDYKDLIYDR